MERRLFAAIVMLVAVIPGHHASIALAAEPSDTYVVQDGDTLTSIAASTGIDPQTLVRINHLTDADTIFVGETLHLRAATAASTAPASRPGTPSLTESMASAYSSGSFSINAASLSTSRTYASVATSTPMNGALQVPLQVNRQASLRPHLPPSAAVQIAVQLAGAPYEYGGTTPTGFDCSGFVQYVMTRIGMDLPRDLMGQYNAGIHPTAGALQPGDLVFFHDTYEEGLSHNGIYLGNDQFIHAIDETRGVGISSLTESYYAEHWYGATRVL